MANGSVMTTAGHPLIADAHRQQQRHQLTELQGGDSGASGTLGNSKPHGRVRGFHGRTPRSKGYF